MNPEEFASWVENLLPENTGKSVRDYVYNMTLIYIKELTNELKGDKKEVKERMGNHRIQEL